MAAKLERSFDGSFLTESSGYLWFQNVAEIEQRPAYVAGLIAVKGDLSHLVGGYRFPADQEIHCGLNGCNQPHQKGYLIATKGGQETVCGNVCGSHHLGVDFDEMEARFSASVAQATKQQTVADLKEKATDWLGTVSTLERQLKSVYAPLQKIRQQFRQDRAADRLLSILLREGGTIKRQRELTKREREILGNPKVRYTSEKVAQVRSVSVLDDYARMANVLAHDLRGNIEEVQRLADITSVKGRQLTAYATAIQRMPTLAKEIQDFIAKARDFLSHDNLAAFLQIRQMDETAGRKLGPLLEDIRSCFTY